MPDRLAAVLCAAVLGAGCQGSAKNATCPRADAAVVASVMAHARTHFRFGDSTIERLERVRALDVPLADADKGGGGVSVLAVRTGTYFPGAKGTVQPAVEVTSLFLLDSRHRVIGPVGRFATAGFSYPVPTSPEWAAFSARVDRSSAATKAENCASDP